MIDILKNVTYQIISPKASARARYETFRELLKNDQQAHELLADLDEIYYQYKKIDINYAVTQYGKLSQAVSVMISCLGKMDPSASTNLRDYFRKIDFFCRFALAPPEIDTTPPFILPLSTVYSDDTHSGGKGYNLAIVKNELQLPVPRGFIISTSAYNTFIQEHGLHRHIGKILARVDIHSNESLNDCSSQLLDLILTAPLPNTVQKALDYGFTELQHQCGNNVKMAVRSSAVGEDSKISFAGQYRSILNVDENTLAEAYKQVLASKFSPRALYYRISHGFHDDSTPMAVLVLEMIDASVSGVITTTDTREGSDETLLIHSLQGQCEALVSGQKSPDTTIIQKGEKINIVKQIPARSGEEHSLSEKNAWQLAAWAIRIESYYKMPQEIEWCIDQQGSLLILQTRFFKTQKKSKQEKIDTSPFAELFSGGELAASGAAAGRVYILNDINKLADIPQDAILVTKTTPPSLATIAHRLKAVVADEGSSADHFAAVAREFNIPTLVKTGNGTEMFAHGQEVTVWTDQLTIFSGIIEPLVEQACIVQEEEDTPFRKALGIAISFISPLKLVNPADPSFVADSCRSLHDIIRFVHEKGVQAMFGMATRKPLRKGGAKLLISDIPLQLYLLDVGEGLTTESTLKKEITVTDISCRPLLDLWAGLTHPGVMWQDRNHFDWGAYDEVIMAGGVVNPKSIIFASYAVISRDYFNLNMRFGYHFAIIDTLYSPDAGENYITLRFAGGGGDMEGKSFRLIMISEILRRLHFTVTQKGDLLDARLSGYNIQKTAETLDMIGRLLGATRIMDMILTDEKMAAEAVEEFMNGRYNFSKE